MTGKCLSVPGDDLGAEPSKEVLEAAHCWENEDRVPGRPAMTAFRRRMRLHQAQWREAHGHPIGTQPIVPRPGVSARPIGSRVPLDYGRTTGAGFVSPAALAAARAIGGDLPPIRIVGCEPAEVGEGMCLSPPVEAAVGPAVALVREVLEAHARGREEEDR